MSRGAAAEFRDRMRRRWAGWGENTRATLLMLLSFGFFTCETIGTRMIGTDLPIVQLVLVRSIAQLSILLPFVLRAGPTVSPRRSCRPRCRP